VKRVRFENQNLNKVNLETDSAEMDIRSFFGQDELMQQNLRWTGSSLTISDNWHPDNDVTVFSGDCRELLLQMPLESVQLIVTSPPYNIGKKYEKRVLLSDYLRREEEVINLCIDRLKPGGSICWQIGNHVDDGEIFPLDILLYEFFAKRGLRLRNRIIWHFEHGLHCSQRFSGRYETILWFTKADRRGAYVFNLDPVRSRKNTLARNTLRGPRKGSIQRIHLARIQATFGLFRT
jgi:adenine-specific DNA-methyltransferase